MSGAPGSKGRACSLSGGSIAVRGSSNIAASALRPIGWGYASFEDRLRRRAELLLKTDWTAFLAQIMPMLQSQESKILNPTSFSPIR